MSGHTARAELRAEALLALRTLAPPHVTRDYRPADAAADAVRRYIRALEDAVEETDDCGEDALP